MRIDDNELCRITPDDIDSHGALRIPRGTTSIMRRLMTYIHNCDIQEISYYDGNSIVRKPIMFIDDYMYVVMQHKTLAGIDVYILSSPEFCDTGICGQKYHALNYQGELYFGEAINDIIKSVRKNEWKKKIENVANKRHTPGYVVDIIMRALAHTIKNNQSIDIKTRQYIDQEIARIYQYIIGINLFCANYKNNDALDELSHLSLQELANIVLPIKSQNIGKTCTHLVKRHPDNANHVHAMMRAGYKNPGCFPYQWLANTPAAQRGKTADELHNAFGRAARDLYSPEYMSHPDLQRRFEPVLNTLAQRITEITGINAQIEYCSRGFFSKTYKITTDDQAYILKVYHSTVQYYTAKECAHDIEAQNSFLVSGKKYCGRVRYRTVLTAGIGHQRGMRYILYPFVTGQKGEIKHNPYDIFKTYHFCDNIGNENLCGDTIIDTGMIHINKCRIGRPYMTKIINTILYRPWDDLAIVLNKYNAAQISESVNFISQRLNASIPKHDTIYAKLQFLSNKVNSR